MLVRMAFDYGYDGELWQESLDGMVTRWLDDAGNEVALPPHVAYHGGPVTPLPGWYSEPVPPPPPPTPVSSSIISDRQFFQALAKRGLITKEEALAAVKVGTMPASLEALVASIPDEEQRFDAEMLLSGATQFDVTNPLVAVVAAGMGMSLDEVAELWAFAGTL